MIHELLLNLDKALPLSPPLIVGTAGILVAVLALWLAGRSRATVLFSLGAAALAIGLAVGLIGLDRPAAPIRWGAIEDLGEGVVGPTQFRGWEQIAAGGLVLGVGLLYAAYNSAFPSKPGERSRRLLEQDGAGQSAGQRPPLPAQVLPALEQARSSGLDPARPLLGGEGPPARKVLLPLRRGHRPRRGRLWATGLGQDPVCHPAGHRRPDA